MIGTTNRCAELSPCAAAAAACNAPLNRVAVLVQGLKQLIDRVRRGHVHHVGNIFEVSRGLDVPRSGGIDEGDLADVGCDVFEAVKGLLDGRVARTRQPCHHSCVTINQRVGELEGACGHKPVRRNAEAPMKIPSSWQSGVLDDLVGEVRIVAVRLLHFGREHKALEVSLQGRVTGLGRLHPRSDRLR